MRQLLMATPLVLLAACTTTMKTSTPTSSGSKKGCRIEGGYNWKHSHPDLTKNLCKLSRKFGPVYVTSSCRTAKNNRGARRSYHLYSRGCKAADIYVNGVKGSTLLNWWGRHVGGGRGSYRCRRFVHVDVGPNRTWHWNTKCRR